MKSPAKALARRAIRKLNRWLEGDVHANTLQEERHRFHNFAYGELNCKMLEIMKEVGALVRPNYTWSVLQAAHLAKSLGLPRISVIEFGVAGGNGLVALEEIAARVGPMIGIGIDVYGFDTGEGLPGILDYRDMPNIYARGTYKMDVDALKKRLKPSTHLYLGDCGETLPGFLASKPAPIGFVSVDVDLYTSTVSALKVLDADPELLLPRVHCYFDDIMGCSCAEFLGERLAMNEFNESHPDAKISPIFGLWNYVPRKHANDLWVHMIYMAHLIKHPLYNADDGMVTHKNEALVAKPAGHRPPAGVSSQPAMAGA